MAVHAALVDYVLSQFGLSHPDSDTASVLAPYQACLPRAAAERRQESLARILTGITRSPTRTQAAHLFTTPAAFVQQQPGGQTPQQFLASMRQMDAESHFEAWAAVIMRAGLTQPGGAGIPGVSLYHEFKLLSALALADAAGTQQYTLVSGRFPGIQETIYTVTSDGAAKSVRGRSFFLQLLAECVVLRLLSEWALPSTNVLVMAGSKFLLLLPPEVEPAVRAVEADINRRMLDVYFGDIYLSLSCAQVSAREVCDGSVFPHKNARPLDSLIDHATDAWDLLFEPYGVGSKFTCAVSRREPINAREVEAARVQRAAWVAPENLAFKQLAVDLANRQQKQQYLVFRRMDTRAASFDAQGRFQPSADYNENLAYMTGWGCDLVAETELAPLDRLTGQTYTLLLNDADFDPRYAHGFRFLANYTPLVSREDAEWARARGLEGDEYTVGSIRPFDVIVGARQSADARFRRVGILRMDVDSLSGVFDRRLQLLERMAYSDALNVFFAGYLPHLCHEVEREAGTSGAHGEASALYVVYGGGDDLFIIGEWDLLPMLAERIREELHVYSDGQLNISAGIVLVPEKFPFYRAADLAGEALAAAKAYKKHDKSKNAITFLGTTVSWSGEWALLRDEHHRLRYLEDQGQLGNNAATLNTFRIYSRWEQDRVLMGAEKSYVGRYTWLAAYQIARMKERQPPNVQKQLCTLLNRLLDKDSIWLSGTAARWAEYERRSGRAQPLPYIIPPTDAGCEENRHES